LLNARSVLLPRDDRREALGNLPDTAHVAQRFIDEALIVLRDLLELNPPRFTWTHGVCRYGLALLAPRRREHDLPVDLHFHDFFFTLPMERAGCLLVCNAVEHGLLPHAQ